MSHITPFWSALFAACFIAQFSPFVFGQGSLTPPGAPAPTMKTLDQLEPRTPISTVPITISAPGSYYLTGNVSVATGDAITINSDDVSLDLNGFTISSTSPLAAGSGSGVLLTSTQANPRKNVRIFNGSIKSPVTYNGTAYNLAGGFMNGIYADYSSTVSVQGVSLAGVRTYGISLGTGNSRVDFCSVETTLFTGIYATAVSNSTAQNCGVGGIFATTAENCYGHGTGGNPGISANTATNCYGVSTSGIGLQAGAANGCYGFSNSGTALSADSANNCRSQSISGKGLLAKTANNCMASSTSGIGLQAEVANNCEGTTGGSTYGLYANIASNCLGNSNTGLGLGATSNASNCVGSGGGGLSAAYAASNCTGIASAGTGLYAPVAKNCYGVSSANGYGVQAVTAENCYGDSNNGTYGVYASRTASGCYGLLRSSIGNGLYADLATNCYGVNQGSGAGLAARVAIGCGGQGGGAGADVYASILANSCITADSPHKYNMP